MSKPTQEDFETFVYVLLWFLGIEAASRLSLSMYLRSLKKKQQEEDSDE